MMALSAGRAVACQINGNDRFAAERNALVGQPYSVWVGRAERSAAPRASSIRLRALNPESSAGNCTPIPGVLEAPPPDGLIHTTLPATGILVGSSSSVRIR